LYKKYPVNHGKKSYKETEIHTKKKDHKRAAARSKHAASAHKSTETTRVSIYHGLWFFLGSNRSQLGVSTSAVAHMLERNE
jgi:hypothetical protein